MRPSWVNSYSCSSACSGSGRSWDCSCCGSCSCSYSACSWASSNSSPTSDWPSWVSSSSWASRVSRIDHSRNSSNRRIRHVQRNWEPHLVDQEYLRILHHSGLDCSHLISIQLQLCFEQRINWLEEHRHHVSHERRTSRNRPSRHDSGSNGSCDCRSRESLRRHDHDSEIRRSLSRHDERGCDEDVLRHDDDPSTDESTVGKRIIEVRHPLHADWSRWRNSHEDHVDFRIWNSPSWNCVRWNESEGLVRNALVHSRNVDSAHRERRSSIRRKYQIGRIWKSEPCSWKRRFWNWRDGEVLQLSVWSNKVRACWNVAQVQRSSIGILRGGVVGWNCTVWR